MTVFSRSFVRKRVISLAATTLVTTASLACARNPMSSYHVPGAMPIQFVNEQPYYHAESPFLSENDAAMNRMMADTMVKPTGDVDRDLVATMPRRRSLVERFGDPDMASSLTALSFDGASRANQARSAP